MTAFRDMVLIDRTIKVGCEHCGDTTIFRPDGSRRVHFAAQGDLKPCPGSWSAKPKAPT